MGKFFKKSILVGIFSFLISMFFLMASCAYAQDVWVEAELSSKKVALDSMLQFTITVHGDNNIESIQLPAIEGFESKYLGPSTHVSIINGQYSSAKSFVYSLFPLKVGTFAIPAFAVNISGKEFKLQSFPIEVVGSMGNVARLQDDQPISLAEKLFIVLKTPKQQVFLNEALPVKIFLYVSGLSLRDIRLPELNNIGFTMEEYEKPQQYQQVVNGQRFDVVEFNTKIYPTRIGELQLGPAKIECNLLVQSSRRKTRFGQIQSIFDDDFLNSFFDRHEKRPVALSTEKVPITVLPLPKEGKPNDFSGAVGHFGFNVSVSPDRVKEGDPITLRMTINGKGNLAAIHFPSLPFEDNFKLYDPHVFEKNTIKKSEQVIIPKSDQITEVPAIQFSYFDPDLNKYRTITKGPFPITVTKLESGEDFKVVGLEGEFRPADPETFGEDIVFIKTRPGKFQISGHHVTNSALFYVIIILAAIFWFGIFLNFKRSHRIKTDIVYARRLRAPRQAKKGLAQAKALIAAGKREEFYDQIFKTLQHYLGNKLQLSSGAVTFENVHAKLSAKNIEPNVIDHIRIIFEECDRVRYASGDIHQDTMNVSYQRLAQNINDLERYLK